MEAICCDDKNLEFGTGMSRAQVSITTLGGGLGEYIYILEPLQHPPWRVVKTRRHA